MNKEALIKVMIFAAGAMIGSAVTWKLVKTKYEKITQEEIESVKEAFSERGKQVTEPEPTEELCDKDETSFNDSIRQAIEISKKAGYTNEPVDDNEDDEEWEEDEFMDAPYVISPEEFGEEDYAIVTLTYHTDGIVTNEDGKIVANTDELVGEDFADHFGDYDHDKDTVYVRNDEQEIDYEILKDYRAYSEIS